MNIKGYIMNKKASTTEELKNYKVVDVEEGNRIAQEILNKQKSINKQMKNCYDNDKWSLLDTEHYDLRQIRRRILNDTGKLAIKRKREKENATN